MDDDNNYRYDVFISYRWIEPDQSWVRNELKPALENAGLEVCLDVDDFVPGRNLILEMTRAGTESRRGVCILSPDYFSPDDRPVNYESLMLRSLDFSGDDSRLIPLILRRAELPPYIRNLIPVDWTNPAYHQREWSKLLAVLGASNLTIPPPGPLVIDPNQPPPPKPPAPLPRQRPRLRISFSMRLWIAIAAVMFLGLIGIGYQAFGGRKIEGTIYYKQSPGSTAMIPVPDVEVFLSSKSSVRSKTGPDGKFVLRGVPRFAAPISLTAIYGNQNFAVPYDPSGVYLVIPPDLPKPRKSISCHWIETPSEQCFPDDGRESVISKVYKCDVEFPAEAAEQTVLLSVELESLETTIRSAHVLATPRGSYRNEAMAGEDLKKSHTWSFNLSDSGLKTQLLVCLGADDRATQISAGGLRTSYVPK